MEEDDWETADHSASIEKNASTRRNKDKWQGEDEEEPVKDNWDDDEEEEDSKSSNAPEAPKATQVARKKKNKLAKAIAQKEAEEEERRLQKVRAAMSPEEVEAEKLKNLKIQEEAEIKIVQQAFGAGDVDTSDPITKDDFDELRNKIVQDLRKFESREPFEDFVEDIVQDLCLSLSSKRLKKVKTNIEALYFEKNRSEKATTTGAKSKGKFKAKLNLDLQKDIFSGATTAGDDYDEFDFM